VRDLKLSRICLLTASRFPAGGSPFPVSGVVRGIILQIFAFVRASCFPKIGLLGSPAGGLFTALSDRLCRHIVLLSWFYWKIKSNRRANQSATGGNVPRCFTCERRSWNLVFLRKLWTADYADDTDLKLNPPCLRVLRGQFRSFGFLHRRSQREQRIPYFVPLSIGSSFFEQEVDRREASRAYEQELTEKTERREAALFAALCSLCCLL
jgi:hypothetical protein